MNRNTVFQYAIAILAGLVIIGLLAFGLASADDVNLKPVPQTAFEGVRGVEVTPTAPSAQSLPAFPALITYTRRDGTTWTDAGMVSRVYTEPSPFKGYMIESVQLSDHLDGFQLDEGTVEVVPL